MPLCLTHNQYYEVQCPQCFPAPPISASSTMPYLCPLCAVKDAELQRLRKIGEAAKEYVDSVPEDNFESTELAALRSALEDK